MSAEHILKPKVGYNTRHCHIKKVKIRVGSFKKKKKIVDYSCIKFF